MYYYITRGMLTIKYIWLVEVQWNRHVHWIFDRFIQVLRSKLLWVILAIFTVQVSVWSTQSFMVKILMTSVQHYEHVKYEYGHCLCWKDTDIHRHQILLSQNKKFKIWFQNILTLLIKTLVCTYTLRIHLENSTRLSDF